MRENQYEKQNERSSVSILIASKMESAIVAGSQYAAYTSHEP